MIDSGLATASHALRNPYRLLGPRAKAALACAARSGARLRGTRQRRSRSYGLPTRADRLDPATIPEDVAPREIVELTNEVIDELRGRLVDKIELAEEGSGYRTSNKVRAYCQVHVRRCLELVESSISLQASGHDLAALIVVRAIYESVAHMLKFQSDLTKLTADIDSDAALERVDTFVSGQTFATKEKRLIKAVENREIEAKNILGAIDHVTKTIKAFREEYEVLCEFTHPNASGAFHWFAELVGDGKVVKLDEQRWESRETERYVFEGALLVTLVVDALNQIEGVLPGLSAAGAKFSPAQKDMTSFGEMGGANH